MALAEFCGVTKRYGDLLALHDLNLEVREGEVLGLLGPNGAGKTTAVRLLCGLMPPSEGRISIGGHDMASDPLAAKRLIGFVPDGAPLYSNLSPRQTFALVGRLHGMGEDELKREGEHLLESLHLIDRIDDPVGQFSRGMRQKVALACALLRKPELLILDEPLSGLDAPTTAVFKAVLRTWADRGGAVLYTSHLLDVVERVCDRMAILDGGELSITGTLDELRAKAGQQGNLDEVFSALTNTEDPEIQARRLLGGATARS